MKKFLAFSAFAAVASAVEDDSKATKVDGEIVTPGAAKHMEHGHETHLGKDVNFHHRPVGTRNDSFYTNSDGEEVPADTYVNEPTANNAEDLLPENKHLMAFLQKMQASQDAGNFDPFMGLLGDDGFGMDMFQGLGLGGFPTMNRGNMRGSNKGFLANKGGSSYSSSSYSSTMNGADGTVHSIQSKAEGSTDADGKFHSKGTHYEGKSKGGKMVDASAQAFENNNGQEATYRGAIENGKPVEHNNGLSADFLKNVHEGAAEFGQNLNNFSQEHAALLMDAPAQQNQKMIAAGAA